VNAWEVALPTMKRGELAEISVRPLYAYGALGCPPRIPPSASLLFEIELLRFEDRSMLSAQVCHPPSVAAAPLYSRCALSMFTRSFVVLVFSSSQGENPSVLISRARHIKNEGAHHFQAGHNRKASKAYSSALQLLQQVKFAVDQVQAEADALRVVLHLNQALCFLKLKEWSRGVASARYVLEREPHNLKGMLRLARLYVGAENLDDALPLLQQLGKLAPSNPTVRIAFQEYREAKKALSERQKRFAHSMFSS
jgi:FK506-binding protein 6